MNKENYLSAQTQKVGLHNLFVNSIKDLAFLDLKNGPITRSSVKYICEVTTIDNKPNGSQVS
jgi:hypothetical protein